MLGFSGIHCGGQENMSPMLWNDALTSQANGATNKIATGTRITYASQYQADRRRRRRGRV